VLRNVASTLVGICAMLVAASGCSAGSPTDRSASSRRQGSGHADVQFGAHVGPGCLGRDSIPAYERFVGRKLERTVDAFNQSSWAAYRSSIPWASHCWKGVPIKLTLSVPMLVFDKDSSLQKGAHGDYDDLALLVARTLVNDGLDKTTIRIGWEFNGNWMPWGAAKDPHAFIAYYRRMVGLMRSVPGQHFQFEWTTGIGKHAIAPDAAYPGDDVVDIIGMDVYNEYWSTALSNPVVRFAWLKNQPYGLTWLRTFAARHGKPTAYSEWGTGTRKDGHGGGDDAYFIEQMAAWFRESGALYASYWEVVDPQYDDRLALGLHPQAAAAFVKAFAKPRP
jgi:hypothetical protein